MAMNWSLVCASTGANGADKPASRPAAMSKVLKFFMNMSPLSIGISNQQLVRERPQTQFFLGDLPQASQSMRLDNQEEDNQRAKQHQLDMRHRGIGERQVQQLRQRRQDVIEKNRQQQDECRSQKSAQNATDTTDDDHEQNPERQIQRKAIRLHRTEITERIQRTGHTAEERTDGKG